MPSNEGSLSERVASSFRQLSAVASDLNSVSDELGKPIAELDVALKKLNLGVEVWVQLRGGDDMPDDPSYWSEDIGYAKVSGKWGISLRTVFGNYNWPDQETVENWLFNDAPRSMRLLGIGKIPELLEKLSSEAAETTNKIKGKLAEAHQVAAVVKEAAEGSGRAGIKRSGPASPFDPPKEQKK